MDIADAMKDVVMTWGTTDDGSSGPGSGNPDNSTTSSESLSSTSTATDMSTGTWSTDSSITTDSWTWSTPTGTFSPSWTWTPCGAAPSATVSGQPAAACGDNFDQMLDAQQGFRSFNDANFPAAMRGFAAGLPNYNPDSFTTESIQYGPDVGNPPSRRLFRRIVSAIKTFAKRDLNPLALLQQAAYVIAMRLKSANADMTAVIANATAVKGQFINDQVSPNTTGMMDTNVPVNLGRSDTQDSQYWGQGYQLTPPDGSDVGSAEFWCIQCQMTGNMHLAGSIRFAFGTPHALLIPNLF